MGQCSVGLVFLVLATVASTAQDPAKLKAGDKAPEFTLPAATKDSILSSGVQFPSAERKRNTILAFYPADWSGGCTTEMCTMRDNFADLATLGADVYGISGDYVYAHREWARQLSLPFPLLSDHDHAVAKTYGSFNEKSGKNFRTVYLVNRSGTIAYIDLKYQAGSPESFARLKSALSTLR
jgi:peroxiredoxin Q/BCP